MRRIIHLPAIILPNRENAQDAQAVITSGEPISVTDLLASIGETSALRFMVDARAPARPDRPRMTWQYIKDGEVVISSTFEYEKDSLGRTTSAAIVFQMSQDVPASSDLPQVIPTLIIQTALQGINNYRDALFKKIRSNYNIGLIGGEFSYEKKNYRFGIVVLCVLSLLIAGVLLVWTFSGKTN